MDSKPFGVKFAKKGKQRKSANAYVGRRLDEVL